MEWVLAGLIGIWALVWIIANVLPFLLALAIKVFIGVIVIGITALLVLPMLGMTILFIK